MGRAYLALYRATKEAAWLSKAAQAARFLDANFQAQGSPGYAAAVASQAEIGVLRPVVEVEENVSVARFAAQLFHETQAPDHRAIAERAMRFLASPSVADGAPGQSAGLLLADEDLAQPLPK
jgi:uncharacterized protein YyaL (SSP411 family)